MLDIFKSYIKTEEYYVILYSNYIYIYNYNEIKKFTDSFISIELNKFKLNISGINLLITKMEKNELLVKGNILKVERLYE